MWLRGRFRLPLKHRTSEIETVDALSSSLLNEIGASLRRCYGKKHTMSA